MLPCPRTPLADVEPMLGPVACDVNKECMHKECRHEFRITLHKEFVRNSLYGLVHELRVQRCARQT